MFPRQQGVALVITLIMLAVITFMAVTFLAVSRREAGSVTVTRDQTTARFTSDTGLERAKAELLAVILGTTNAYNFDLLVSTNFVNWDGFDPNPPYDYRTNVNYGWRRTGAALTANEALQNLANLLLNPRPPVFITNRFFANSNEFRFYLDLNRNGRYDTNGLWPVISPNNLLYDTNGNSPPLPNVQIASNYFAGDPEWIGILERPDRPHSATNRFIARYAYIVVPSGKTLDVNYVHNQAKQPIPAADGFFRNQGVGSWEINMAGFLADLNTNYWQADPRYGSPYSYLPQGLSSGAAFDDAMSLVRYRYAGNYRNILPFVVNLFGNQGANAFNRDFVDGYSGGPLMTNYWGWNVLVDQDQVQSRPLKNWWPGGENFNHFFTTQDFFDRKKTDYPGLRAPFTPWTFSDRLWSAGTNISSYDRYTFYRLLSQLGTDSATEPTSKINLNYVNVGGVSATNFIAWDDPDIGPGNLARGIPTFNVPGSVLFFTNAADKLLRQYTSEWRDADTNLFQATYGMTKAFGVTDIPVLVSNRFVYTPSVHRLLQLAANIYDTTTTRSIPVNSSPQLPSVFRPIVRRQGSDVYVVGYTDVETVTLPIASNPLFARPLDLNNPADLNSVPTVGTPPLPNDVNVYGVPWVIGAKKGLPNFNEYAMQTVFQVTRKLEVRRPTQTAPQSQWTTNMMYVVGVSNYVGAEAWNSYRTDFTRAVDIFVVNDVFMALTNGLPGNPWELQKSNTLVSVISVPAAGPQQWRGFFPGTTNSFLVPLRTNITLVPNAAYTFSPPGFTMNWNFAWTPLTPLQNQQPLWRLATASKLRFIMVDKLSQRVVDYVQLDGLNSRREVSEEIRDPDNAVGFAALWSTNFMSGSTLPQGILNQITISLGLNGGATTDWIPYDLGSHSTKDFEIDYFRAFYGLNPFKYPSLVNTNLVQQVPFTPTKRVQQYLTWQANDPLVHYTSGDLADLKTAGSLIKGLATDPPINNIGKLNTRYEPWGGNPERGSIDATRDFNTALKDPGVGRSDDWQFPTNKFSNIGWLGRVHRGTPWQTIYLKSTDILGTAGWSVWTNWTGNASVSFFNTNLVWDAARTVPESDRLLFDLFTTAFNENATRGQLSVNQSGQAAWSALLSGVVALTNSSTDTELNGFIPVTRFNPWIIDPVGTAGTNSPLWKIVDGINRERNRVIGTDAAGQPIFAHSGRTFRHVGDILAVPEMTTNSPFLNRSSATQLQKGINDAVYEWLPQQVMSLLQVGEPRFVVYSYGQTLRPAPASIVTLGTFQGLCTNYQVTAEVATRAVMRLEGSPDPSKTDPDLPPAKRYPPRVVIENFNLLSPD